MEDNKLRKPGMRPADVAERAEHGRLVKYFQEEEQKANLKNLLFEQAPFSKPVDKTKE